MMTDFLYAFLRGAGMLLICLLICSGAAEYVRHLCWVWHTRKYGPINKIASYVMEGDRLKEVEQTFYPCDYGKGYFCKICNNPKVQKKWPGAACHTVAMQCRESLFNDKDNNDVSKKDEGDEKD